MHAFEIRGILILMIFFFYDFLLYFLLELRVGSVPYFPSSPSRRIGRVPILLNGVETTNEQGKDWMKLPLEKRT